MTKNKNPYQSGQIGVIIVLIMSVLLTVGLSMSANTNSDLFISQQEEESNRVFNAAEAGIEEALSGNLVFSENPATGTVAKIADIGINYQVNSLRILETRVFEGSSLKIDVQGAATGNQLNLNWAKETTCSGEKKISPASLLISVYYDDAGTIKTRHYAYGGCDYSDNFIPAIVVNNEGYKRGITVTLTEDDLFVRIKPVYNDTNIRARGFGWNLPYQGFLIRSEAESDLGNENRSVEVIRSLPNAPAVMDYSLYSGSTISK